MPYNTVEFSVEVCNVPQSVSGDYIVARLCNGVLWYFGTYETEERAMKCCEQFENGIIVKRGDNNAMGK